ncbi:MAG: hypothetical protein LPL29_14505 [Alphaproteobacteria bacterium]|nr:hypothetical protein [Alphaproteobacteria bacterium]
MRTVMAVLAAGVLALAPPVYSQPIIPFFPDGTPMRVIELCMPYAFVSKGMKADGYRLLMRDITLDGEKVAEFWISAGDSRVRFVLTGTESSISCMKHEGPSWFNLV